MLVRATVKRITAEMPALAQTTVKRMKTAIRRFVENKVVQVMLGVSAIILTGDIR